MSTKTERNRDHILQKLFRYTDEERWFAKQDFEAAAREAGFKDVRTIFGRRSEDSSYWNDMQVLKIIETVQLMDGRLMGRMSQPIYDKLDALGTTLTVEARIEVKGRGKKAQVIELRELM
jgi:hypothetical protein